MVMRVPHIGDESLDLRPASIVMNLARLGTLYPYPLSFMRSLVRRILREAWEIKRVWTALCDGGFGDVVYEIQTPNALFSYVVFAKYIDPDRRSDRVIADDWDLTVTLCEGRVDAERLEFLRANVPLQENGRVDASCIVLSRANKSVRNFDYVVDGLARGEQPDLDHMAKVGYLYRTTAVYGSGKFGMADWNKVREAYPDFARPFAAEMFSCFLIRDFSLFQADYVAQRRAPDTAVAMTPEIKRYVGIGNATGLGMAPFLIHHPLLINNWIEVRETALARVKRDGEVTAKTRGDLSCLAEKAQMHLSQITTDNADQNEINRTAVRDLTAVMAWLQTQDKLEKWTQLTDYVAAHFGHEAQEIVNALLLELHPETFTDLEPDLSIEERYDLVPHMRLSDLAAVIEDKYRWALAVDFSTDAGLGTFWYRSVEKQEPRLGQSHKEPGYRRQMFMGVAYQVRRAYDDILARNGDMTTAEFVLAHPEHRAIIRRIQTMAQTRYGEIQANLLDADVLPIHLLRCKLSFFGVGKFDPRSRLWVRNTMFQGAPLIRDIGQMTDDIWCFPIKPDADVVPA
ncbi:hypothetical protein AB8615_00340 [Litorimonas sp. RW-G-Af-16]|uniref:hypothetical protein n=1 Tax=Litorimonas sp. RW-G-Af-16 TaxID=3241168 RepID=UPI003AAF75B3